MSRKKAKDGVSLTPAELEQAKEESNRPPTIKYTHGRDQVIGDEEETIHWRRDSNGVWRPQ